MKFVRTQLKPQMMSVFPRTCVCWKQVYILSICTVPSLRTSSNCFHCPTSSYLTGFWLQFITLTNWLFSKQYSPILLIEWVSFMQASSHLRRNVTSLKWQKWNEIRDSEEHKWLTYFKPNLAYNEKATKQQLQGQAPEVTVISYKGRIKQ